MDFIKSLIYDEKQFYFLKFREFYLFNVELTLLTFIKYGHYHKGFCLLGLIYQAATDVQGKLISVCDILRISKQLIWSRIKLSQNDLFGEIKIYYHEIKNSFAKVYRVVFDAVIAFRIF